MDVEPLGRLYQTLSSSSQPNAPVFHASDALLILLSCLSRLSSEIPRHLPDFTPGHLTWSSPAAQRKSAACGAPRSKKDRAPRHFPRCRSPFRMSQDLDGPSTQNTVDLDGLAPPRNPQITNFEIESFNPFFAELCEAGQKCAELSPPRCCTLGTPVSWTVTQWGSSWARQASLSIYMGIVTSNKKLLVAPGIATRSKKLL